MLSVKDQKHLLIATMARDIAELTKALGEFCKGETTKEKVEEAEAAFLMSYKKYRELDGNPVLEN